MMIHSAIISNFSNVNETPVPSNKERHISLKAVDKPFQALNTQGATNDISQKEVQELRLPSSVDHSASLNQAFEHLMGETYDSENANPIDNWIYGLLKAAVQGDLQTLKRNLSRYVRLCSHPDNQNTIHTLAYKLAKQAGKEEICTYLLDEKNLDESTENFTFDLTREGNALIFAIGRGRLSAGHRISAAVLCGAMVVSSWFLGHPIFRAICEVRTKIPELHGTLVEKCLDNYGAIYPSGFARCVTKVECLARAGDASIFLRDYLGIIWAVSALGIAIVGTNYLLKQKRETTQTFDQLVQRFIDNNKLQAAINFCKTYPRFISHRNEKITQVGQKALELHDTKLATEAANAMTNKFKADRLFSQIISQAQNEK